MDWQGFYLPFARNFLAGLAAKGEIVLVIDGSQTAQATTTLMLCRGFAIPVILLHQSQGFLVRIIGITIESKYFRIFLGSCPSSNSRIAFPFLSASPDLSRGSLLVPFILFHSLKLRTFFRRSNFETVTILPEPLPDRLPAYRCGPNLLPGYLR